MFIANLAKLLPGDILLITQRHLVSKGIRFLTHSAYSHSSLYTGDSSFIHATGEGVHSENLQRLIFNNDSEFKVLRLVDFNERGVQIAVDFCRQRIGTEYSIREAIKARNPLNANKKSDQRQFCSRLIAQAFAEAGVDLVKAPSYCSPADLEKSEKLKEITGVLRPASSAELEFAKLESPIKKQTDITNQILREARELTAVDLQRFGDVTHFVISNPKFDEAMSEIIERSGYLEIWKTDFKKNKWRYESRIFIALPLSKTELKKEAERERDMAIKNIARFRRMHNVFSSLQSNFGIGLKYLSLHIELYSTLVSVQQNRLNAAKETLDKT